MLVHVVHICTTHKVWIHVYADAGLSTSTRVIRMKFPFFPRLMPVSPLLAFLCSLSTTTTTYMYIHAVLTTTAYRHVVPTTTTYRHTALHAHEYGRAM